MNPPRFSRRQFLGSATLAAAAATLAPNLVTATPARTSGLAADRLAWWREARFGMFVHWGPVSLKGTEIGWSRGGERRGLKMGGTGNIPVAEYDNLYRQFNPVRFDADEWIRIAKDAGMRYLVFTSRHHDGFSMFDTKLSDYNIMRSPYGKDICAQLADAAHRASFPIGWYHSQPDWYHPDYFTARHGRYLDYLHGQVRELLTNYGKIDIMWFDGLDGTAKDYAAEKLFDMIHSLQPDIIINDRCGLPGDFDTPEQHVGSFQINRPWESCITIARQWAWRPDDEMKSLQECLQTLVMSACGDGNLLFNVGPMPDGRIEPRQVDRLREMGDWLKRYGESIYGTRGGPFMPAAIAQTGWYKRPRALYGSTYRDNRIYLHVFGWPGGSISLPPLPGKIVDSSLLTGGEVDVKQTDEGIHISVPEAHRQETDTIVRLEMSEPVRV